MGHGGAGFGVMARGGLDLDVAVDAMRAGITGHGIQGWRWLARKIRSMPAAEVHPAQSAPVQRAGQTMAVRCPVHGVIVQQKRHAVTAELDVEFHHAESSGGTGADCRQGVFGGQVPPAAMGDEGRPGPGRMGRGHGVIIEKGQSAF